MHLAKELNLQLDELNRLCRFGAYVPEHIEQMLSRANRIAFAGIGKSHHIAQLTACMFASLGIPAIALDGPSIVHGDAGFIKQGDAIVFLSKSGNTTELIDAAQCIRQLGIDIVLLTQNFEYATVWNTISLVWVPIGGTIEINGYSPTTSSLVFVAVLNALACKMQKFSKAEFLLRHPGGAIGKQH